MTNGLFSSVLILSIFLISCSDNGPTNPEVELNTVRSVDGRIELSELSKRQTISDLDIMSFHETDDIQADNSFDIDVYHSEIPQMVFAVNSEKKLVLGATVFIDTDEVVITEESTANTFILLSPLFWHASEDDLKQIIADAPTCNSYQLLLQNIKQVFNEDPDNLYNPEIHPEIIELATAVGYEVMQKHENYRLAKHNSVDGIGTSAPILDINYDNPGKVIIKNNNFVALTMDILNQTKNEEEELFSLVPRSGLIEFRPSLPPVRVSMPAETEHYFEKDQDFLLTATKGFDFSLPSSKWFYYKHANGRATILNILLIVQQVVKFVVPGGGQAIMLGKEEYKLINESLSESQTHINEFIEAKNRKDVFGAAKALIQFLIVNSEALIKGYLGAGAATLYRLDNSMLLTQIKSLVKSFTPFMKGFQAVNETIPLLSDLIFGPRKFIYTIKTDPSGDVYNTTDLDPEAPEIPTITSAKWFLFHQGIATNNWYVRVSAHSRDYTYKKLKYYIIVESKYGMVHAETKIYETEFFEIGEKFEERDFRAQGNDAFRVTVQAEDEQGHKSAMSRTVIPEPIN